MSIQRTKVRWRHRGMKLETYPAFQTVIRFQKIRWNRFSCLETRLKLESLNKTEINCRLFPGIRGVHGRRRRPCDVTSTVGSQCESQISCSVGQSLGGPVMLHCGNFESYYRGLMSNLWGLGFGSPSLHYLTTVRVIISINWSSWTVAILTFDLILACSVIFKLGLYYLWIEGRNYVAWFNLDGGSRVVSNMVFFLSFSAKELYSADPAPMTLSFNKVTIWSSSFD